MNPRPQTALRGVFSVGFINLLSRVCGYGKHIAITALIGLSAQLDAFYMAMAVLSLVILVFGDIFDSLGIPRLVDVLRREGEERFREQAGSILAFAVLVSLGLCVLLAVAAPVAPRIAPGFPPRNKRYILGNLMRLAPVAMLYLPYHALGSFLRAKRRFHGFYLGELLVSLVSLLLIVSFHGFPYIIPLSLSAAYLVAFLCMIFLCRREFLARWVPETETLRGMTGLLTRLLPVYATYYLFVLVDRTFASYLPTGAVSALTYGSLIVMLPSSILTVENIFVTPLAESDEKGILIRQILNGIFLLAVPIAFFTAAYAEPIVKAALERGAFHAGSTRMTGEALAFFAFAIPAFFAVPVCGRVFLILEKLGPVAGIGLGAVAVNAILNGLFLRAGMGIRGLALATSVAWYTYFAGYLVLLRKFGMLEGAKRIASVLAISVGISAVSLSGTFLVPMDAGTPAGLAVRGGVFLLATGVLVWIVPNEEVRFFRETVAREVRPKRS